MYFDDYTLNKMIGADGGCTNPLDVFHENNPLGDAKATLVAAMVIRQSIDELKCALELKLDGIDNRLNDLDTASQSISNVLLDIRGSIDDLTSAWKES